jgi:hypothetical protein
MKKPCEHKILRRAFPTSSHEYDLHPSGFGIRLDLSSFSVHPVPFAIRISMSQSIRPQSFPEIVGLSDVEHPLACVRQKDDHCARSEETPYSYQSYAKQHVYSVVPALLCILLCPTEIAQIEFFPCDEALDEDSVKRGLLVQNPGQRHHKRARSPG